MSDSQTSRGTVLVTGGAGFIAAHSIAALLRQGFSVRATARSTNRSDAVCATVSAAGADPSGLEIAAADLTADAGWAEAMEGCVGVLHVASPVPHAEPENPDDVVVPAREGTMRVLRAARSAGVQRVVLTSAFGAVGFGHGPTEHRFTEADWSLLDGPGMSLYNRAKTLAEKDAWAYAEGEGDGLELVTLCPVAVVGPVVSDSLSGGNAMIRDLLAGRLKATVDLWLPLVDVRDVAVAHVSALTTPEAGGERFIIGSGDGMTMAQIATFLRAALGKRASDVPRHTIPTPLVKAGAKVVPALRDIAPDLGSPKNIDLSKAQRVLGLNPHPGREAVATAARSILDRGLAG